MPTTIKVAIVAAALLGVLGAYAAVSGGFENALLVAMAAWIVRGAIVRDGSMQELAFGFALIGSLTTGAPAAVLLVRGLLERRTDVYSSIPMLAAQLAPFAALAWCLSRRSAYLWFEAGRDKGPRRPVPAGR